MLRSAHAILVLVTLVTLPVAAQEPPPPEPIENLGISFLQVFGDRWVYSASESFEGEDLNGDGDRDDMIVRVRRPATGEVLTFPLAGFGITLEDQLLAVAVPEHQQGLDLNNDGDTNDPVLHFIDLETQRIRNVGLEASLVHFDSTRAILQVGEWNDGLDRNDDGDTRDLVFQVFDFASGAITNLGLVAERYLLASNRLILSVNERQQGADLNSDGDLNDVVDHVHDLSTGLTKNLGLGTTRSPAALNVPVSGRWLVLAISEIHQGEDLNADGDSADVVFHVHDLVDETTVNLGLAGIGSWLVDNWLVINVREVSQGEDLNGDGDLTDGVVHVHDLSAGRTRNTGFAGFGARVSGDTLILAVNEGEEGRDLNGDGEIDDLVVHLHDMPTGATRNLGLAQRFLTLVERRIVMTVREGPGDLNDDGDTEDAIFHVHDLDADETWSLGLGGTFWRHSEEAFLIFVDEAEEGSDINGDGDLDDTVVHRHDLETRITRAAPLVGDFGRVEGARIVIPVSETGTASDLNGDGDLDDDVPHLHDFATGQTRNLGLNAWVEAIDERHVILRVSEAGQGQDLNNDGDRLDRVGHVFDIGSETMTNLGLAGGDDDVELLGDRLIFDVSEREQGEDLNLDGDTEDLVLHAIDLGAPAAIGPFLRGDCDGDGAFVGLTDAIVLLTHNFTGNTEPTCRASCDANGDGSTAGVADPIYMLTHAFLGGPPPLAPFPACGRSARPGDLALGCREPLGACR